MLLPFTIANRQVAVLPDEIVIPFRLAQVQTISYPRITTDRRQPTPSKEDQAPLPKPTATFVLGQPRRNPVRPWRAVRTELKKRSRVAENTCD